MFNVCKERDSFFKKNNEECVLLSTANIPRDIWWEEIEPSYIVLDRRLCIGNFMNMIRCPRVVSWDAKVFFLFETQWHLPTNEV